MKTFQELISRDDPAIGLIREWALSASTSVEILPPSDQQEAVLVALQVKTSSVLGAVAFETGGIIVDKGWLRLLGSGHKGFSRTLPSWNKGKSDGFYLVADDVAGGFFAINGGSLGEDHGKMYYFAPDRLEWESMNIDYPQFVWWCMSDRVQKYYESLRWKSWRTDLVEIVSDRCAFWYPPLWTKEGNLEESRRGTVPVAEAWGSSMDFRAQLGNA